MADVCNMSDDASAITGSRKSILIMPDYVRQRGYRYIRFVLRDDRIVWQGCHTYDDAVAGRWLDIDEEGCYPSQESVP